MGWHFIHLAKWHTMRKRGLTYHRWMKQHVGVENLLQNKHGKMITSSVPAIEVVIAFEDGDILIGNIRPYLRKKWLADCNGGTNGDVLAIQVEDKSK